MTASNAPAEVSHAKLPRDVIMLRYSSIAGVPRICPLFHFQICSSSKTLAALSALVHGCGAPRRLSSATLNGGTWLPVEVMYSRHALFWWPSTIIEPSELKLEKYLHCSVLNINMRGTAPT